MWWILTSGTSESPGIGCFLFWWFPQVPWKWHLNPIKFNGIWCLALLSSMDMIFLFWSSPSNPLENLSQNYHIWRFPVSTAPNPSRPRFLLFWGLSLTHLKTYQKPIKFNGFSCLATWVTRGWISLILVHVRNPFETLSQPSQIQWNLMSGTSELQGYDFPIPRLSIKLSGKPIPNLSLLTISSVHGPGAF